MCDAGTNFILEKFQELYRKLKIHHAVSLSYNNQIKGQVEAYINFVKCTMKKCFYTNQDVNLALLQMRSTPVRNGLPSPATVLFNRPIRELSPMINRMLMLYDYDDEHYDAMK